MKENKYKLNEFGRNHIIDGAEQELSAAIERTEGNKEERKKGAKFTMYLPESQLGVMFDNYK